MTFAASSTVAISSFSILPTGMPVQAEITSPTICASTHTRISGVSPCKCVQLGSLQARASCSRTAVSRLAPPCGSRLVAGLRRTAPRPAAPASAAPAAPESARPGRLSFSQRSRSSARRASSAAFCSAISARRSAWSAPSAASRSRIRVCTARSSIRRVASSMAGGVAFCPSASRAQAVSSTLTALSGSWRPAR